jgi:hypothetical protein
MESKYWNIGLYINWTHRWFLSISHIILSNGYLASVSSYPDYVVMIWNPNNGSFFYTLLETLVTLPNGDLASASYDEQFSCKLVSAVGSQNKYLIVNARSFLQ